MAYHDAYNPGQQSNRARTAQARLAYETESRYRALLAAFVPAAAILAAAAIVMSRLLVA
jgi:hypothetical protein